MLQPEKVATPPDAVAVSPLVPPLVHARAPWSCHRSRRCRHETRSVTLPLSEATTFPFASSTLTTGSVPNAVAPRHDHQPAGVLKHSCGRQSMIVSDWVPLATGLFG